MDHGANAQLAADFGIGRLFDLIPDAVVVGDARSGLILLWNPAAAALFGYSEEEALGLPIETLVDPSLVEAHRSGLRHYAETGVGTGLVRDQQLVEVPARSRSGLQLWVELRLAPLVSATTDGTYVLAVIRDVTERRVAREAAAESLLQVESANQALRSTLDALAFTRDQLAREERLAMGARLAAPVEQALRNPLGVTTNVLFLLRKRLAEIGADQLAPLLDTAEHETVIASRMVEDLLYLTAHEDAEAGPSDLGQVLTAVLEASAIPDHVRVEVLGPDRPVTVALAEPRLSRLLGHLVTNAIDSMPEGGSLAVRSHVGAPRVHISVSDTGSGLSEEAGRRAFEPLFTTKPGRAGLGLTVARSIAAAAGGSLSIGAGQGRGSTFELVLLGGETA